MKDWLKKSIFVLCLMAFASAPALAQTRIATVDLRKAFEGYWKKREAEATLKEQQTDMEKDLKAMVDEIKKSREAYQKLLNDASDQAVSADEREKRKKLAEDKLRDVKDLEDRATTFNRTASNNLDEKKKRVRDNIITDIKNIASAKAKEKGASLVIDTAAETVNGTPFVIYSNNEMDLTDAVLAQLNAGAPTQGAKPDEKKK
jgi:outer membrane protein